MVGLKFSSERTCGAFAGLGHKKVVLIKGLSYERGGCIAGFHCTEKGFSKNVFHFRQNQLVYNKFIQRVR